MYVVFQVVTANGFGSFNGHQSVMSRLLIWAEAKILCQDKYCVSMEYSNSKIYYGASDPRQN